MRYVFVFITSICVTLEKLICCSDFQVFKHTHFPDAIFINNFPVIDLCSLSVLFTPAENWQEIAFLMCHPQTRAMTVMAL